MDNISFHPSLRSSWYRMRRALLLAMLILSLVAGPAFTGRAASSFPREVKRTARALRIKPEELLQVRQALREVTELVLKDPEAAAHQIGNLVYAWQRLHASEATAQSERLFDALRNRVERADPDVAAALAGALIPVIQSVAQTDPEGAWTLLQQWPAVPNTTADSDGGHVASDPSDDSYFRQAQQSVLVQWALCDPRRAGALIRELVNDRRSSPPDHQSLLLNVSNPELRAQLAQEALAIYKDQPLTQETVAQYMRLLPMLSGLEGDLKSSTVRELVRRLKTPEADAVAEAPVVLRAGQTAVQLEGAEVLSLDLLRSLRWQPGLLLQTLAEFPGLTQKIDRIGGWDVALQSDARITDPNGMRTEDLTPRPRARVPARDAGSEEPSCHRRNEPASPSPAELRELATQESGFESLMVEAHLYRHIQPDYAEEALRLAEDLVDQAESAQEKADRLVALAQAYMGLDGEVDSDLLEKAFAAVAQADLVVAQPADRTASDADEDQIKAAAGDESLALEARLFALWGHTDVRRALDRARALPTEERRLAAMLAILAAVGADGECC